MAGKSLRTMTTGNPAKLILLFSLPLMVGNIFQQLYTVVDTVVVGQALGVSALAALGADKDTAVYVGDSEVDVQTARNAGLPLIAVSWGFRGRRALAETGAAVIVDPEEEIV